MSIGAFGVFVVDPGKDNDFAGSVVAKKQAVLLKKLGAEPVLMVRAKRAALPVFWSAGIFGDDFECQLRDGRETLGGIAFCITVRIFGALRGHLAG
ncbi:hypothetical protein D3C87_1675420 [compost metagenome]